METAVILLSAPNETGILKETSDFIAKHKGNIVALQQIVEKRENQLFMRIKWTSSSEFACDWKLYDEFKQVAKKYNMQYSLSCSNAKKRLVLFASKTTHALEKVLYRWSEGELPIDVVAIIGNFKNTEKFAKFYGVPFHFVSTKEEGYEGKQLELLKKYDPDFIGLARYMKVLSKNFVNQYPNKIINIHHSFLPCFIGAQPYEDAYNRGVKLIGATSHFVIPALDQGPIIHQDVSKVREGWDAVKLEEQGKETEAKVFFYAIRKFAEDKLFIYKNKVIVFN